MERKFLASASVGLSVLLVPLVVSAQQTIQGLILTVGMIVSRTIPVLVGLAVLFFVWGLTLFIREAGSEDAQKRARQIMLWGIIAIFVMVSVWGFVAILQNTVFGSTDLNRSSW
jgi:ribose/xylose/arabinose/galactoside ABC-type transport system permease subunit